MCIKFSLTNQEPAVFKVVSENEPLKVQGQICGRQKHLIIKPFALIKQRKSHTVKILLVGSFPHNNMLFDLQL